MTERTGDPGLIIFERAKRAGTKSGSGNTLRNRTSKLPKSESRPSDTNDPPIKLIVTTRFFVAK